MNLKKGFLSAGLIGLMSFCSAVSAKMLPIAQTGYSLNCPDSFNSGRPDNAPNILLQCASPRGEATIQVITAIAGATGESIAQDYESKMVEVLSNFQVVGTDQYDVAGKPTNFRVYQASDGNGGYIRVMAFFYVDQQQGFVLHSLDQNGNLEQLVKSLASLKAPARKAAKPKMPALKKILPPSKPSNTQAAPKPAQVAPKATPKPVQATPAKSAFTPPAGYHWFTEDTSALRWHTPKTWPVEMMGANPVLLPPAGDQLADSAGIKVQNLDKSKPQYSSVGAAVKELMGWISGSQGTVLNRSDESCNGIKCHIVEFRITLGEDKHHMWFVYVERPNIMTVIQYDAYGTLFDLRDKYKLLKPHMDAMKSSLREVNSN